MAFNSTFRYIDDVLSVNNLYVHSYVDIINPSELKIKLPQCLFHILNNILLEKDILK